MRKNIRLPKAINLKDATLASKCSLGRRRRISYRKEQSDDYNAFELSPFYNDKTGETLPTDWHRKHHNCTRYCSN